jgi:hypothetical protein
MRRHFGRNALPARSSRQRTLNFDIPFEGGEHDDASLWKLRWRIISATTV